MDLGFLSRFEVIYLRVFLRYFLVAGLAFLFFYIIFKKQWSWKKIQPKFPDRKDFIREISYSILSIGIFSFIAWLIILGPIRPYNFLFQSIDVMPWWYYVLTFPFMFILHDTWFYWTHRMMHHPKLFKVFHLVHHKSVNPSPWAAYAFHPFEACLEAGILILISFVIPTHVIFLGLFFLCSIIYNVYGHLGFELYPNGLTRHWLGKWLNTSINHNMHHKYFDSNYALYFTFWDKWMKTTHPDYEATYNEITVRKKNTL